MPELPEVETVRRGLSPAMVGARIERVELRRGDIRFPFPPRFRERLTDKRIVALTRRAKYLLIALEGGETLIAHLGMSGSFRIEDATPGAFHRPRSKDPKHDHVVLHLDNGKVITYHDPRRFGFMDLARTDDVERHPRLAGLGIEPLAPDFDGKRLAALFAGVRAPLKAALLTRRGSRAWATFMFARRFSGRGCRRCGRPATSPMREAARQGGRTRSPTRSTMCSGRRSSPADRRSRVTDKRTASWAIFSTRSRFTTARARPVRGQAATGRSPRCAIRALDVLLSGLPEIARRLCEGRAVNSKFGLTVTATCGLVCTYVA